MALNNYANLKTAIANFLARDDLTSEIDDFIDLTEADFNRRLRIRAMETVNTSFTIDAETEALPTGFLQVRSFILTSTTPDRTLELLSPFHQASLSANDTTGTPRTYSIEGTNFRFQPIPGTAVTARLTFYKAFDAIDSSTTTNHILTNHPDVYLYGALYFASTFLRGMDQQSVAQFKAQYEGAIKQVEDADDLDKYNGTPLIQRSGININNFDNVK
ncbi:conserved protein of unknown function [uncultured Mediterranean phage uvMED]|nr:conserved protein of unknown function [uncultured Mediterranean phage uvMED]|tara:strand:+ start:421 stop:1071 length:651 start_codon:yes stop_codon:yes gene_type:complete